MHPYELIYDVCAEEFFGFKGLIETAALIYRHQHFDAVFKPYEIIVLAVSRSRMHEPGAAVHQDVLAEDKFRSSIV